MKEKINPLSPRRSEFEVVSPPKLEIADHEKEGNQAAVLGGPFEDTCGFAHR
ncbi:MAG TPA: hypothetical protein VEM15_14470 [Thermodesulfobacteriota bacterium]|nr:hypothetical protein [Thermodesulfobacteriota bacterium]